MVWGLLDIALVLVVTRSFRTFGSDRPVGVRPRRWTTRRKCGLDPEILHSLAPAISS